MDRLKKLNGSMIVAIVLSVLLILSVSAGATLAWFGSRDSASTSLTMGEAIVVTVGEDYKQGEGKLAMNLPVSEGGLLPGMVVTPNVKIQLQKSNSNALLRARFITTVEYPDNYVDAAYKNKTKYPDQLATTENPTGETKVGRVLSAETFPDDNVYAGDMYYDYYNYLGRRLSSDLKTEITQQAQNNAQEELAKQNPDYTIVDAAHTKKIHLSRVKVRDGIIAQIDKGADESQKTGWVINGTRIAVTASNAAEIEIRQRGVDLTDAINRVLQGQAGYSIDSATGELEEGGIKYTRRVADGWAYRDADQAWYYLGSQTNGYVISGNTFGTSESVDTNKPVAKDIASYSTTQAGNLTVQTPNYALLSAFVQDDATKTNPYHTTLSGGNDKTRNYLGGDSTDHSIDSIRNEIGVLNQETIASVDLSQGDVSIDFLTKKFALPTFINNDYALAKVTFTFTVEAVQDYLVDPLQEATAAADRLPNNLVNAILVFNNAFPQTLYPHSTIAEDKLRATGSTANVLPGGGDSGITTGGTSPSWLNTENGETTVTYVNTGNTEGKYGYLTDTHIGTNGKATGAAVSATPYTYKASQGAEDLTITSKIKGFSVKKDEYGDYVADYTTTANYVRGTASSLGICPFVTAQVGTYNPK